MLGWAPTYMPTLVNLMLEQQHKMMGQLENMLPKDIGTQILQMQKLMHQLY